MMLPRRVRFGLTFCAMLLVALAPLAALVAVEQLRPAPVPQTEAARAAAELDRLLQMRMGEAFALADFPSIRAFAASLPPDRTARAAVANNELNALVTADPAIREAFIVDTTGKTILSTGSAWNVGWGNRSFIKQALAGKLDASAVSEDLDEFSQYYASPVLDNRGDVAGAMVLRVAAQELWQAVNAASAPAEGRYAVLLDENGVRLADGGDPARNLTALAPLPADRQARIVQEQTYGAQVSLIKATSYARAAEAVLEGQPEGMGATDLGVESLTVRRVTGKPWTVVAVRPPQSPAVSASRMAIPLAVALVAAAAAAWWLTR